MQSYTYVSVSEMSTFVSCRAIYDMCTQKPPNDHSEALYRRYRQAFENYIRDKVRRKGFGNVGLCEKVIDSLKGLFGEYLLRELHKRWSNHKIMVRWLSNFFNYLDRYGFENRMEETCVFRYYVARHSLDNLQKVGNHTFRGTKRGVWMSHGFSR